MIELSYFPIRLSPSLVVFLSLLSLGVIAIIGEGVSSTPSASLGFFLIPALIFGGLAWFADTYFSTRWSLTKRFVDRDPAVEALRKRYAGGELDEIEFEEKRQRLREV